METLVFVSRLCALLNEAMHTTPGQAGQQKLERALYWVWAQSMLHLFELAQSPWRTKWRQFFDELALNSRSYSLARMDVPFVTYIKLHVDQTKSYVGSTKESIVGREASRRRAFVCKDSTRRVEPAFQWWQQTDSYWEFCPIVLEMFDSHSDAITRELAIHDVRKPELVAPYIWRFLLQPNRMHKSLHVS